VAGLSPGFELGETVSLEQAQYSFGLQILDEFASLLDFLYYRPYD